jgi:16S rRNA processing protein RimM
VDAPATGAAAARTVRGGVGIERMARWDEMVVVGRIARPHGIRGQVIVNPETDFPEQRFHKGASFWIRASQGVEPVAI